MNMRSLLPELGLELNSAKCVITLLGRPPDNIRASIVGMMEDVLPGILETPLDHLNLLGSPLHDSGIQAATETAADTVSTLCNRVRALDSHTAVFFLTHHVSAPRLQYLLRSSPIYRHRAGLQDIDGIVRLALADVCNVNLDDRSWTQATLPTRHGGLSVRSVESLALPCYIASLTASTPLIASIIPQIVMSGAPSALKPAIDCFRTSTGVQELPDPSLSGQQRTWDDAASVACRDQLLGDLNQVHRARFLASCQPHTAAWLQALPVASLGLLLDPETVRIAVALRLGAPVCEPHVCRLCGRQVKLLGHHALSCQKSVGRFPRHAHLNDLVKRILSAAGIPSVLEPAGLDRGDGRRPDGLTTFPFSSGKCLAWDATCSDTFADSVVIASAVEPGTAARAAEARKMKRYASLSPQYIFAPLAVETTGVIGTEGTRLIKELGRRITSTTGERRETSWLWQRLSMAIIRGNAAAIRGSAAQTASIPVSTHYVQRPANNSQNDSANNSDGGHSSETSATPAQPSTVGSDPKSKTDRSHSSETSAAPAQPSTAGSYLKISTDGSRPPEYQLEGSSDTGGASGGQFGARPPGLTGLQNIGNTCFMNSVFQCLSNTKALQDYILHHEYSNDINTSTSTMKGALIKAFGGLMCELWKRSDDTERVLTTAPLKSQIQRFAPRFTGHQQQDAHEFLCFLLLGLHEDVNRVTSRPNPITTDIDDSSSASEKSVEAWKCFLRLEDSKVRRHIRRSV